MDYPFYVSGPIESHPRRALAPWVPLALIVAVLGSAALASAFTPDTRDVAARHATVLTRSAL